MKDQNIEKYQHYIDIRETTLPRPSGTTTAVVSSRYKPRQTDRILQK